MPNMKILIKLIHILLCVGIAQSVYAQKSSLTGQRVRLPPETRLVRASDNATVKIAQTSTVTFQDPILGAGRRLLFPVTLGNSKYYVQEETAKSMGLINNAECDLLRSKMRSSNQRDLGQVAQAASRVQVSLSNLRSPNSGGWAEACSNFISSNGQIGPWGTAFLSAANQVSTGGHSAMTVLHQPQLWRTVCPGFRNFSAEQKNHFIVSFIATKAMDEASCNPNAYNNSRKMPNPPGVGFFQLEGQARLRQGRGSYCAGGKTSGVQDRLPIDTQFKCAASQIVTTQWGRGIPFCNSGGYWQEANGMGKDICQTMAAYPGCGV